MVDELPDGFTLCGVVDVDKTGPWSELATTGMRHVPSHQLKHRTIVLLGSRKILPTVWITCIVLL